MRVTAAPDFDEPDEWATDDTRWYQTGDQEGNHDE